MTRETWAITLRNMIWGNKCPIDRVVAYQQSLNCETIPTIPAIYAPTGHIPQNCLGDAPDVEALRLPIVGRSVSANSFECRYNAARLRLKSHGNVQITMLLSDPDSLLRKTEDELVALGENYGTKCSESKSLYELVDTIPLSDVRTTTELIYLHDYTVDEAAQYLNLTPEIIRAHIADAYGRMCYGVWNH